MNIASWPIVFVDGYYRYVNHELRLLSSGFLTRENLIKNAGIMRTDPSVVNIMRNRYETVYKGRP